MKTGKIISVLTTLNYYKKNYEIDLNKDIFLRRSFVSKTSSTYDIYCTESYYKHIGKPIQLGTSSSLEGTFICIGWLDVHDSHDEYYKLFIRAKVPDYFIQNINDKKQDLKRINKILSKLFEKIGYDSNTITYSVYIIGDSNIFSLENRKDILY